MHRPESQIYTAFLAAAAIFESQKRIIVHRLFWPAFVTAWGAGERAGARAGAEAGARAREGARALLGVEVDAGWSSAGAGGVLGHEPERAGAGPRAGKNANK